VENGRKRFWEVLENAREQVVGCHRKPVLPFLVHADSSRQLVMCFRNGKLVHLQNLGFFMLYSL